MARPSETLQNYLDDLLLDLDSCDDSIDSVSSEPEPSVEPLETEESQPKRLTPECSEATEVSAELEAQLYLAEEKKRQLQQLLMPVPLIEDSVIEGSIVEESIASEPTDQIVQDFDVPSSSVHIKTEILNVEVTPHVSSELDDSLISEINPIEKFLTWGENGRPMWAQHKFDALLFEVSGLALAVPLIALGQIVHMSTDKLTPLFGRSEWFMGLLTTSAGQIRVINTALFVMPERYNASFLKSTNYVVSMDGHPWGLAVDSVTQPITLDPEDVKWRGERTSRPWLAGTVKSKMCALIDIPQMAKLLNTPNNTMPP